MGTSCIQTIELHPPRRSRHAHFLSSTHEDEPINRQLAAFITVLLRRVDSHSSPAELQTPLLALALVEYVGPFDGCQLAKPGGGWGTCYWLHSRTGWDLRARKNGVHAIYYKIRGPVRITQSLIFVQHKYNIILLRKPVNEMKMTTSCQH